MALLIALIVFVSGIETAAGDKVCYQQEMHRACLYHVDQLHNCIGPLTLFLYRCVQLDVV